MKHFVITVGVFSSAKKVLAKPLVIRPMELIFHSVALDKTVNNIIFLFYLFALSFSLWALFQSAFWELIPT